MTIKQDVEILYDINLIKHTSKKQVTLERIYSVIKKTRKNLAQNKLESFLESKNMVEKNLLEYHPRNGFYNVPEITEDSVWAQQTQKTDNGIISTPSAYDSPRIGVTHHHDERDRDSKKHATRESIATKLKAFKRISSYCGNNIVRTGGRCNVRF